MIYLILKIRGLNEENQTLAGHLSIFLNKFCFKLWPHHRNLLGPPSACGDPNLRVVPCMAGGNDRCRKGCMDNLFGELILA